jgi:hypothetical protein
MTAIATRIDVEQTEKNLGDIQKKINELKNDITKAVNALMQEENELEEDLFWRLMDEFKNFITRYSSGGEMNNAIIKSAAHSFIHTLTFNHVRGLNTDRKTAISFSKTYKSLTDRLSKSLWDTIEGFGDDGYGDCIDSFPLYGKDAVVRGLKGELDGLDPYQGENYVRMSLQNAIEELYPISCNYDYRTFDEEEEGE